jgi:hypothetical protein
MRYTLDDYVRRDPRIMEVYHATQHLYAGETFVITT